MSTTTQATESRPYAPVQERLVTGVLTVWAAHQQGDIDYRGFLKFALLSLSGARTMIAHRTDFTLAKASGKDPVGYVPKDSWEVDSASIATVTDDPARAPMRIERFLRATTDKAQREYVVTIAAQMGAIGWRWRRTEGDCCDVCKPKKATVRSIHEKFEPAHPGCDCYPEIVWKPKQKKGEQPE